MKNIDRITKHFRRTEWMIAAIFGCISLITVFPIILSTGYTFYQTDDFNHAKTVGVFGESIIDLFVASLKFDLKMYLNWQGTYTAMFLQAFLSPLNGMGRMQLQVIMIFNIILFLVSIWMFINAACKKINIGNICESVILFSLCAMGIFAFTGWTEVFYWFSGAVAYSFPMSFCFLGIAINLCFEQSWGGYIAGTLMFLASGGSLEVAGTGCFYFAGNLYHKADDRERE